MEMSPNPEKPPGPLGPLQLDKYQGGASMVEAKHPEADGASTASNRECELKGGPPEGPPFNCPPLSPLFRFKASCMRFFLRLFGAFPRLFCRLSDALGAFKGSPFGLDSAQLKLMGIALLLLLAYRLRRLRPSEKSLSAAAPQTSAKPHADASQGPGVSSAVSSSVSSSVPSSVSSSVSSSVPSSFSFSLFTWPAAKRKLAGAPEISFSEVLELVAADAVEEVHYSSGSRLLLLLKDRRRLTSTLVPGADASFFRAVAARVPRFRFVKAASFSELFSVIFPVILLCLWWRMLRSLIDPLRGAKDTGTDRGLEASPPLTVFSDVVCRQKHELLEVVLLLNGEGRYRSMGARLPRGVLLVGPSGTGKTLLARAVAGESRVSFLSAAASEFVEVFVGQGARRVREIFQAARRRAPCVLFIDELDALGSRGGPLAAPAGHEEYVQTVNQFLMEMDGLCGPSDGVVVIAATNRIEAIDPALLRSGRFDRHIHLQLPSAQERHEILKLHVGSKKLHLAREAWGHLQLVAEAAEGLSGADLENLLNESVFRAIRRGRESIDPQALDEALLALLQRAEKQTRFCG